VFDLWLLKSIRKAFHFPLRDAPSGTCHQLVFAQPQPHDVFQADRRDQGHTKHVLEDFCLRTALCERLLVSIQAGQHCLLHSGGLVPCWTPSCREEKPLCHRTLRDSVAFAVLPWVTESQKGRGWKGPLWVI